MSFCEIDALLHLAYFVLQDLLRLLLLLRLDPESIVRTVQQQQKGFPISK